MSVPSSSINFYQLVYCSHCTLLCVRVSADTGYQILQLIRKNLSGYSDYYQFLVLPVSQLTAHWLQYQRLLQNGNSNHSLI